MPEVNLRTTPIRDFHSGMIQGVENPLMPNSAVREAINCHFDNISTVELRPGLTRLGPQITGAGASLDVSPGATTVDGWVGYNRVTVEYDLFGDNSIDAAKWTVSGKVVEESTELRLYSGFLESYDDFAGGSIDGAKFTVVSGTAEVVSGRLRLWGDTSHTGDTTRVNTDNKTAPTPPGEPIYGLEFFWNWVGGGPEGNDRYAGLTDGSSEIRLKSEHAGAGVTRIEWTGNYGTGNYGINGTSSGTFKILEANGNIYLYWNGSLVQTLTGVVIQPNSYFFATANRIDGSNNYLEIDNIKVIRQYTSTVDTDNKTNGDPVEGFKWDQTHVGGTHADGGTVYGEITNNTDYIRIAHRMSDDNILITSAGSYGVTAAAAFAAAGGTVEVVESGPDIIVRVDNIIRHTITNKKFAASSFLRATANVTTPGDQHYLKLDNVYTNVGTSNTFAAVRAAQGTSADTTETTSDVPKLKASTTTDEYTQLRRGIFVFDTSSIPDAAVIDSVLLRLFVNSKITTLGSQSVSVVKVTTPSNTTLSGDDFDNFEDTKIATDLTLAGITAAAYNEWTFNATGRDHLNKKSLTKVGIRLASDVDNSAPTWVSAAEASININTADNASNKPMLRITYTVGDDINGLHQFLDAGDGTFNRLVVQAGGTHYYYTGAVWTSVDTDRSDGITERYLNALGYMFVTNPLDGMQTWTGNVSGVTYPSSANLKGRWRMNDASNAAADDATALNHDLTDNTAGIAADTSDFKESTASRVLESASSEYFSSTDNADHSITGAMTMGGWFKFTTLAAVMSLIQKWNTTGNQRSYKLTVSAAGELTFGVSVDGTAEKLLTTTIAALVINTWYRIVVTYNPSERMEIYVDGVSKAFTNTSVPASIFDSTAQFEVGRNQGGADQFLNGKVDDIFIMNLTWTASQVRENHNSYTPTTFGTVNAVEAPKAYFLEFYKNQVYAARTDEHPDRVFKSSLPNVLTGLVTWNTDEDFLDVNPSDGENLTGMRRLATELLFFKRNYLYRYYGVEGTDPDPLINIGTYSNESIVIAKNGCYFHHPSGIYLYGGGQPQEISRPIKDIIENVDRTKLDKVAGWDDPDHVYESLGDITIDGVTISNLVARYTISTQTWTLYSYSNSELLRGIHYDTGSELEVVVADDNSSVHQFNEGTSDNSAPIFYSLKTKWYEMQSLANTFNISQLAAYCVRAQGMHLSYQVDDWKENEWRPIDTLQKFVWVSDKNLALKGHRISFRLHGASTSTAWIFKGLEILSGIVNAFPNVRA